MIGKLAVVLFNLGGPDQLSAVRPFLFNLFKDPAIIRLPFGLRHLVAGLIAWRRAPVATEIYRKMGGRSPILPETEAQARALAFGLSETAEQVRVEIAMRYWHPFSDQTAAELAEWEPDRIVLLPLYPQYSTTTSASSLADWKRAAAKAGLTAETNEILSYPRNTGWVMAQADLLRTTLAEIGEAAKCRVLFSAHGLPKKIVEAGDPYPKQVQAGVKAIIATLGQADLDWKICYQSRVGPLEWIGPSTETEIRQAGKDGKGLVVVPIAFVSEHSETKVELDIEYAELAKRHKVPFYRRVATVGNHPLFIGGLTSLVGEVLKGGGKK